MHKLIVVGTGIKSISHLTEETKRIIQNADKVLYLVNENHLKHWIQREAKNSESLEPMYFAHPKRIVAYQAITDFIVDEYTKVSTLCVVFYGHPTVFADSALKAVKQITQQGGNAIILPAISAQDCLYSDLKIDPGNQGCFSIEATELLIYERKIDPFSHLIIWQIANLGSFNTNQTTKLNVLSDYLLHFYPSNQPICIYEAPTLPLEKPRIEWSELNDFPNLEINSISMLYIPPNHNTKLSDKYISLLEIDLDNFSSEVKT
ncbi:TPA: methylase [Legionella pneumophila]|nr:methylase [Legionella pneumophila]HAU1943865.1 methylase [Legionella pneumophila]HCX3250679.1 methylase [Legionella pneumophila]